MFGLGPLEIVLIGALAVMLYGKRLPEVGRSVGQSLGELRRQMTSLKREMDISAHIDGIGSASGKRSSARRIDDGGAGPTTTAARFDPPPQDDVA